MCIGGWGDMSGKSGGSSQGWGRVEVAVSARLLSICVLTSCLWVGIFPSFGETLILVPGLSPTYLSGLLFHRTPEAQVVLGRRRTKGGKGQGGRSGLPWDHVILLSARALFLVNMSVEGVGYSVSHPADTLMTIITITLSLV